MHSPGKFTRRSRSLLAASAALLGASVAAQGTSGPIGTEARMTPGYWEIASVHEVPGSNSKRSIQSRLCYASADLASPSGMVPPARGLGMRCETSGARLNGSSLTWAVTCKGKEATIAGTGQSTIGATSYAASLQLKQTVKGKSLLIDQQITGKRLGDCK